MTPTARFLFGAVGGLLPLLVAFATLDIASFASLIDDGKLTLGISTGYCLKCAGLFLLGGIVALLNSSVISPLGLVQIGIAAPAVITGYMTAATLKQASTTAPATQISLSGLLVTPAQAQSVTSIVQSGDQSPFWNDVWTGLQPGLGTLKAGTQDGKFRPCPEPSTI